VNQERKPTIIEALVTVLMMAVVIIVGIRFQSGLKGVFLPMTLAVGIVGGPSLLFTQALANPPGKHLFRCQ
jgi:hypothetical protein